MSCFRLAVIHHRRSWWILNQPSIIKSSTRGLLLSERRWCSGGGALIYLPPSRLFLTWSTSAATGAPLWVHRDQASPCVGGYNPGETWYARNREIPSATVLHRRWHREAVSATSGLIVAGLRGDIRTHTGSHFPVLLTADITRWGGGGYTASCQSCFIILRWSLGRRRRRSHRFKALFKTRLLFKIWVTRPETGVKTKQKTSKESLERREWEFRKASNGKKLSRLSVRLNVAICFFTKGQADRVVHWSRHRVHLIKIRLCIGWPLWGSVELTAPSWCWDSGSICVINWTHNGTFPNLTLPDECCRWELGTMDVQHFKLEIKKGYCLLAGGSIVKSFSYLTT